MKKLLLFLALPCMALVSFAQINKGNTLLGGTLGFYFQQNSSSAPTSVSNSNIKPYIQFAYKANRTIGFGLDFGYSSYNDDNMQSKSQYFSLAPSISLTQYHPLKGSFGWWLQQGGGVNFNATRQISGDNELNTEYGSAFVNLTPGIYYTVGEKKQWLLNASVGGLGGAYNKTVDTEYFSIYTNLFQSFELGFAYIFRKS